MSTVIVGLIYLVVERLFGSTPGLLAALIIVFCFPFIYYSHTSNVDIPYLFWFPLGFYFYVKLLGVSRVGATLSFLRRVWPWRLPRKTRPMACSCFSRSAFYCFAWGNSRATDRLYLFGRG